MDQSKYKQSDLWKWFFEKGITKQADAERKFPATYGKNINPSIKSIIHAELKSYNRGLQKQKSAKGSEKQLCPVPYEDKLLFEDVQMDSDSSDDEDEEEDEDGPSDTKKPRGNYKPFTSLKSSKQKRRRTKEIWRAIKEFAIKEDASIDEGTTFSITNLLGYFLHSENYLMNKEVAEIGERLFKNLPLTNTDIDTTEAVVLMHDLDLSKNGMRTLKSYWPGKFPNTNKTTEVRKKLRPEIQRLSDFTENKSETYSGVAVSYTQLIKLTTASVLDVVQMRDPQLLPTISSLKMTYKDGADGAGSQAKMRSVDMYHEGDHIYQHAVVPLRLEGVMRNGDQTVIWKNETPNSAFSCRPQALIRGKEDRELIAYDLNYVEKEQAKLEASSTTVVSFRSPDQAYDVNHKIIDSMKDLKLKKTASGAGGAACLLCDSKKKEWMIKETVQSGFPINRTAEMTKLMYQQIMDDEEKGIKTKDTKGVTQEPITKSDQISVCVLHSLINCTNWFLKIITRLKANVKMWKEEQYGNRGDRIRDAKKKVQKMFEEQTGLRIDMVNLVGEKTGGSTKGNDGRDFFHHKAAKVREVMRQAVVPAQHHQALLELHRDLGVILRIMSCTGKVDVMGFRKLTKETNLLIIREFPWAEKNFTLHGCLSHSADLIELNDGRGLGELSEEVRFAFHL